MKSSVSALPSWARSPVIPLHSPIDIRPSQWEHFKKNIGNWIGIRAYYKLSGGEPFKEVETTRSFKLSSSPPEELERVDHHGILRDKKAANDQQPLESRHRFFDSDPPRFAQKVLPDGQLGSPAPGIFLFTPHGAGSWLTPSAQAFKERFAIERYILHPHIANVQLCFAAMLDHTEVHFISITREENRDNHSGYPSKASFSLATEAQLFGKENNDALPKRPFVAVEHNVKADMTLSSSVHNVEGLPGLPVGVQWTSLQLPDGIAVSVPCRLGPEQIEMGLTLEILWKLDRGSWLHSRVEYAEDGKFSNDCTTVYYEV